jgi:hypothetical protein
MQFDLPGDWIGTSYTDGLWYTPNLVNIDGTYAGGQGYGGPPQTDNVNLEIKWQGDYQNYDYDYQEVMASPFYGRLVGTQEGPTIPVSGFINTDGFIQCCFYTSPHSEPPGVQPPPQLDWSFSGWVTTRGWYHTLSGQWVKTTWTDGAVTYQLGTLSVNRAVSLKEIDSIPVNPRRPPFKP